MQKFFYGRNRDPHDSRDHVLRMMRTNRLSVGELDVFTGLSLPVYDQGQLGSCTANAGVLYRRWLAQKFPQYTVGKDQDLSRLFLYYTERAIDGDIQDDAGSTTRTCCQAICKVGICPESDFPYDISTFTDQPAPQSYTDAVPYKGGAYHRAPDADTVISVLVSGYPSLLGVTLYPSFESIDSTGFMPMPDAGEENDPEGHEMVIHGYSSSRKAFRVQNSWSADWGDRGKFWMPEAYLDNLKLSQPDFAIIHLGPPWGNPPASGW